MTMLLMRGLIISRCLEEKLSKKTSQLVGLTAHDLQTADSVTLLCLNVHWKCTKNEDGVNNTQGWSRNCPSLIVLMVSVDVKQPLKKEKKKSRNCLCRVQSVQACWPGHLYHWCSTCKIKCGNVSNHESSVFVPAGPESAALQWRSVGFLLCLVVSLARFLLSSSWIFSWWVGGGGGGCDTS